MRPATLEVRDLTVRFGGVVAVDDVSFAVSPGEVVGLIGPNGAGKTTIIDAVTGFVRPTAGSIVLDDARRSSRGRAEPAGPRRHRPLVPVARAVRGHDASYENLRAGASRATRLAYVTDLVRPGRPAARPRRSRRVREFGLEDDLDRLPDELAVRPPPPRRPSPGPIAAAPSVLLLDEPAAGLDDDRDAASSAT